MNINCILNGVKCDCGKEHNCSIEKALTDKILKKVIFSGEKILIPDETAIEEVKKKTSETELVIGIGSGLIQDLCKYVSFFIRMVHKFAEQNRQLLQRQDTDIQAKGRRNQEYLVTDAKFKRN